MVKKFLLVCIMLCGVFTMSYASLSVNTGDCALQSGTTYTFPDMTVSGSGSGYVIRFMFTRATTSNDVITLPTLPTGWSENANSTQYVRMIDIAAGASAADLQTYLRTVQVKFDASKKGQGIMVLISENASDAGRLMYYNSTNDHWYEYVKESKQAAYTGHPYGVPYEWWEAYNRALDKTFMGLNGYLATITSSSENDFIWTVSSGKMGWIGGARGDITGVMDSNHKYLTGRPSYGSSCTDQSKFLNYWYWASGPEYDATRTAANPEGVPANAVFYNKVKWNGSAAAVTVTYNYAPWGSGQPDNAVNAGSCYENSAAGENYLHLGLGGGKGWNDYGVYGYNPAGPTSSSTIAGMVVEYQGIITAATGSGVVGYESKKISSITSGTKSSPTQIVYSDVITYTITTVNASTSSTVVTVADTVPAGLTVSNISDGGTFNATTRVITWNLTVATEGSYAVTYNATPTAGACLAAGGPDFFNTAKVTSDGNVIKITDTTYHRGKAALVTFAAGTNGNITNGTAQTVDYSTSALTGVTAIPNTGYKFTNWSYPSYTDLKSTVQAAGTNTDYTAISIYGDVLLTANFDLITYNITYNLDGGTHTSTPATYDYSQSVSIAPPKKIGYTFTGWTVVNDSTSSPSISQPATPATTATTFGPKTVYGNLTLTANWKVNSYTITYSLPTGATHPQTPVSYLFTDAVTVTNPSMPGYTFLGWTITNDSVSSPTITPTTNVSFGPSTVYGNLTFTAATPPATGGGNTNWSQITYKITYNLNGGTSGTNHPATYTVTSNVTIDIPTKLGYTFAGWTIVSDSASASLPTSGNPTTFASGSNVYGNLTFTAKWSTDQYMITYKAGATGATLDNPPVNNPTTYDVTNTPISLDNGGAKYNGYTFDKWQIVSSVSGVTVPSGMTIPANTTGNLTCTALWSLNNYNITYTIPSGVTNPNTLSSYDVTQSVTISNPSMPGYTFLGWTITNDSVSSPTITPTTNVAWTPNTIFGNLNFSITNATGPNWSENTYTITYVYAGGTAPATANPTTYTVTTPTIALNPPTRAGYTFSGWTIVSDSSSVTVPVGTSIPTGTYGNLTCTAVWGAIPYNITYDYNDDATDPSTTPANPTTYNLNILPVSISLPPTRNTWDFTGWTGSNGTIPQTSVTITSTSLGVPGDLSYTANWTKKKYTVTYDLNSGTGTAPTDANSPYEWGLSVSVLDTLTGTSKANAAFVGWTTTVQPAVITSPSDTVGFGSHNPGTLFAMPTQNITLYAVWAEDINGPGGGSDGVPDYLQIKLIYNENQKMGSQSISGTLPQTTMHTKNTSATVSGNTGNLQRNPADSLILLGWSQTIQDNKDVKVAADKPSDLILCGTTIPVEESDINLYAVWAYDVNGNGIADCDEPNLTITIANEWPETESGTPTWNYQYDRDNATSWYSGCDMILTMTVSPDPQFERTININYIGALKKGFVVDEDGEVLADSYTLAKGESVFTMHISIVEDSITSANEGQTGAVETAIVGGGRDTSEWFTLYSHPSYEIILVKPLIRSDKTVDFGITGGTPNLMRSINGGPWHNAYSALTAAEQLSVTDGASIWLREPNGCWEAEFVFMTYTDPTVLRYVDIPSTTGVTTDPGVGKHYVEGHQDFSFTASYAGGSPLKVMAKGYYTGTYEELIGQDMDNGMYKYTIVQVTEPWNITFGPELASGTVDNELTDNTKVWSFNNMLYIRSEVNTKVDIYNISGTLYKRLTITEGDTHEEMLRGIYVVAIGDKRFKVIVK